MDRDSFNELFKKYEAGTLSEPEKRLLERWYNHFAAESDSQANPEDTEARLASVAERLPLYPVSNTRRLYYRIAAAAMLFVLAAGVWLYDQQKTVQTPLAQQEIRPGGNKAMLTFSDGKTVDLSESQSGIRLVGEAIAYLDGTTVLKDHPSRSMTLSTPIGGTYQITLADGTRVWLNAGSTLRYPTAFTEKSRVVELQGEAYFEVAHRTDQPFKVLSKGQEVQVLGTVFNVQAYTDEPLVKTTLVEGSVQVWNQQSKAVRKLQPGEQSTVQGDATRIASVDVGQYTAWKEGLFRYNNQPLAEIMRNVARWYNVEVVFTDPSLKEEGFVGMVSRYSNLSAVLAVLEEVGSARFTVQGNKVIIDKK